MQGRIVFLNGKPMTDDQLGVRIRSTRWSDLGVRSAEHPRRPAVGVIAFPESQLQGVLGPRMLGAEMSQGRSMKW